MIVPYISREDVGEALASLIYRRELETNGLRHLLLVDLLVSAPEMPAGDSVRDFAVRELLVREIVQALTEQRTVFQLAPLDEKASVELVRHEIAETVEQGAHQLIVWSLLYYRYARADLAFSVETLAKLLVIHLRTISRYNDEGVQLLTERLMLAEYQARQAQMERRLLAALPYSVPVRLKGRVEQMQIVHEMLATHSPRHFLITGAVGVGKTTFVQEVLRQQISAEKLEQLVWIERPRSVEYVRQRITEALLHEEGTPTVREYLLLYPTAIVFDGIDVLAADRAAFEQLLRDLGAAIVILINQFYISLVGMAHLLLPELDFDTSFELLENLIPENDDEYKAVVTRGLYQRFGGNPLALRLGLGLWLNTGNWDVVQEELDKRLLGQLFLVLSEAEKDAWCMLTLFPQAGRFSVLTSTWGLSLLALRMLQQHGLLQSDGEIYELIRAARDFIQHEYAYMPQVKGRVDALFDRIETLGNSFEVIEHALMTGFPEMSVLQRQRWVHAGWQEGLRRNHWAVWRTILETYMRENAHFNEEVSIAYGKCLRRLGYWAEAVRVFEQVVRETGLAGHFDQQAHVFLEFSLLVKDRGDYARAYSSLQQAKRFAERVRDAKLLTHVVQQEAELLIQQGRGAEAYERLVSQPQNLQILTLESEAQFVLGNQEECRELALRALKLVDQNQATEAALYTIIGRSFEQQGDSEQAQRYLTNAVMLLERLKDLYSLARAQTNLAALLIRAQHYMDASRLLSESERIQISLGDHVGLSATRHNRLILARYIAR